ncbi:MAG: hypothetical protein GKR91_17025 [Pseudomonadales bacterium]|nr:hypothetical protein [Pseudomonadales bacterium]
MKLLTLLSVATFTLLIGTNTANAGPHPGHQHKRVVVERNVVVHRPAPVRTAISRVVGSVFHSIPANHLRVVHAGKVYFIHDGVYYAKRANGYVVVNPTAGVRLTTLPRGYSTVRINGETLYRYRDINYRRINGVYIVV